MATQDREAATRPADESQRAMAVRLAEAEASLGRAEQALRMAEVRLRTLSAAVEQSPACIVVTDIDAKIQYVNPQFVRLTGYSFNEAIGQNPRILKTEHTPPATHKDLWATVTAGRPWHGQFCNKKKNGELYWESAAIAPISDERHGITGYVAVKADITAQRRMEEELRFRSVILATQQEASLDGILVVDEHGAIISHNGRFVEMWGMPQEIIDSRSDERVLQWVLDKVVDPDTFMRRVKHLYENKNKIGSYTIRLKDGRTFERYSAPMFSADGKYYGRVWYFRDQTEAAHYRDILEKLSATDGLTGIANRRQFDESLTREWRRAERTHAPVSLLLCDIDFFKLYNDHYGHQAGDECLRQVALILASGARRPADLPARYGGEEFVCLLPETDAPGALHEAELLRARMEEMNLPHAHSSVAPRVTLSIGVATAIPQPGRSPADLVRRADELMYEAKRNGRNRICGG